MPSLVGSEMCIRDRPGDIIAVESPCYYGTMQMLRGLGLKTIEIPTDPETGISIEALELALDQWPIKGVILVPNCNNPLGFIMPDARKRAVLNLSLIHISEPTRLGMISYAVFCLKKKKTYKLHPATKKMTRNTIHIHPAANAQNKQQWYLQ